MSEQTQVVLVDLVGNILGTQEKLAAHKDNALHLAFSLMLYRHTKNGIELLLQQRANDKYHSGGLWANTCCSHPSPNEDLIEAASRRLSEELNFTQELEWEYCGQFVYQASFDNGLHEHELDNVLIAEYKNELPVPNPDEVAQLAWINMASLIADLETSSDKYAVWLPHVMKQLTPFLIKV